MNLPQRNRQEVATPTEKTQDAVLGLWGVRYQVKDVRRSVAFYTQTLGFNLDQQYLPTSQMARTQMRVAEAL